MKSKISIKKIYGPTRQKDYSELDKTFCHHIILTKQGTETEQQSPSAHGMRRTEKPQLAKDLIETFRAKVLEKFQDDRPLRFEVKIQSNASEKTSLWISSTENNETNGSIVLVHQTLQ